MKRWMVVAAAVSVLTACGGDDDSPLGSQGGLSGGGAGGGGVLVPGPGGGGSTTRNSAGLWVGTTQRDGSSDVGDMLMLITESGEIASWAEVSDDQVLDFFGDASGSGTNFSAEAETYVNFAPTSETSFEGTVISGQTLSGSYTFGASSATFDLDYSQRYERSASLAKIQGVYSDPFSTLTITIGANGSLNGNIDDTCTIVGNVSVPRADRNYYRFNGELVNCNSFSGDMSALMFLTDSSASSQDDTVVLMGQTDSNSTSVFLEATK